jgi:hypothetical protein
LAEHSRTARLSDRNSTVGSFERRPWAAAPQSSPPSAVELGSLGSITTESIRATHTRRDMWSRIRGESQAISRRRSDTINIPHNWIPLPTHLSGRDCTIMWARSVCRCASGATMAGGTPDAGGGHCRSNPAVSMGNSFPVDLTPLDLSRFEPNAASATLRRL